MQAPDHQQRLVALNTQQSFIVQAPAGSGKTELLTQRFLKLLTTVEQYPEEVLAITFTKKAAHEMRERIIQTLHTAAHSPEPEQAHQKLSWRIAQEVIEVDHKHTWQLLENPNRLRIQTIDSFCSYLSKQLPLLSGFGGAINANDDCAYEYEQAAEAVIQGVEQQVSWQPHIADLLLHLDNNLSVVKRLFINLLMQRDQWLAYVVLAKQRENLRVPLESTLQEIINTHLEQLTHLLPMDIQQELLVLRQFACEQLGTEAPAEFPKNHFNDLLSWQKFVDFLLTTQGELRKQVNKRNGFPPAKDADNPSNKARYTEMKQRMSQLLKDIASIDGLGTMLEQTQHLPSPHYSESQWRIVNALLHLLPILVAQLQVTFAASGKTDFIEVNQRALRALESEGMVTDLALHLDNKIKHILVDEFQDTSAVQLHLLKLLTQDWSADGQRTLFLVGDPMQSIYRFRGAEVGLFLQVQQTGIGNIHLTPLTLQCNFRSTSTLVQWFNQLFPAVFPARDDMASGAVSYSSSATLNQQQGNYRFFRCDPEQPDEQGQCVATIIKQEQRKAPDQSIAVLVRNRQQLRYVIPALKHANIAFSAVEIDPLLHVPEIQDLTTLLAALLSPADRLHWLALLRTPWCGLCLSDLTIIANEAASSSIWSTLHSDIIETLSENGQQRIRCFVTALAPVLEQRGRLPLSEWVRAAWVSLLGDEISQSPSDCQQFFQLLASFEQRQPIFSLTRFTDKLERLYASEQHTDNAVQIMTIHKSKGLEFDTVILPDLNTTSRSNDASLLLWQERPVAEHELEILLAPLCAKAEQADPIYQYIRRFQQQKDRYEQARVFYVALTRARHNIYALANIKADSSPQHGSFAHYLWQHHQEAFISFTGNDDKAYSSAHHPMRLSDQAISQQGSKICIEKTECHGGNRPSVADPLPSQFGTAVHFLLQQLSVMPQSDWSRLLTNTDYLQHLLHQHQIVGDAFEYYYPQLLSCIEQLTQSQRAQWLLTDHPHAASELALNVIHENQVQHLVIDRTFITDGIRWIIDYKTTQPAEGQTMEGFFNEQQTLYISQLIRYADAFVDENIPVKLALYFPLIDGWHELKAW